MDFSAKMWKDIPGVVAYHYKEGNINWPMGTYVTLVHILALVGIPKVMACSEKTLIFAFLLWPLRCVPK